MNFEYLLFNIIVISGPIYFGVQSKYGFKKYAKTAITAVIITAVPYLIWDSIVTYEHWYFNEKYTLPVRLFNLPIGEILFFITVPFACLFTWEMISQNIKEVIFVEKKLIKTIFAIIPFIGTLIFISGLQYTGLAIIAVGLAIFLDYVLGTKLLFSRNFNLYLILVILFTLIFNWYLTARPVVLYGIQYQLDFRIITIPIEDFVYGISLMYFATAIYEYLKRKKFS
jgi:lycopene cyclase domain-containing protein